MHQVMTGQQEWNPNEWRTVVVKDDVIAIKDSTHIKGQNKHSGKSFSRFQPRKATFYSWRSDRLRVYTNQPKIGFRDETSHALGTLTNKYLMNDGMSTYKLDDPFEMRFGQTKAEVLKNNYPLVEFLAPLDGLTPKLNRPDMQTFTRDLFGTKYRKDLARTIAELATWTNPQVASRMTALALGLSRTVPIDWLVEYLKAEGARSDVRNTAMMWALTPKQIKELFQSADQMQIRRALRNSTGQVTHLFDAHRSLKAIQSRKADYSLSDLHFKDFQELHDVLARDFRKMDVMEQDIEYKGKAAKLAGDYGDFIIEAPTTTHSLVDWGTTMNNCIGSYGSAAIRGTSLLYAVRDQEGKMLGNMELRPKDGSVVQLVGRNNGRFPGELQGIHDAIRRVWKSANVSGGYQPNANWDEEDDVW